MTAKQLRKQLKKFDKNCHVHIEVFAIGSGYSISPAGSTYSLYGHLISVSQSEPNVVVLSNSQSKPNAVILSNRKQAP